MPDPNRPSRWYGNAYIPVGFSGVGSVENRRRTNYVDWSDASDDFILNTDIGKLYGRPIALTKQEMRTVWKSAKKARLQVDKVAPEGSIVDTTPAADLDNEVVIPKPWRNLHSWDGAMTLPSQSETISTRPGWVKSRGGQISDYDSGEDYFDDPPGAVQKAIDEYTWFFENDNYPVWGIVRGGVEYANTEYNGVSFHDTAAWEDWLKDKLDEAFGASVTLGSYSGHSLVVESATGVLGPDDLLWVYPVFGGASVYTFSFTVILDAVGIYGELFFGTNNFFSPSTASVKLEPALYFVGDAGTVADIAARDAVDTSLAEAGVRVWVEDSDGAGTPAGYEWDGDEWVVAGGLAEVDCQRVAFYNFTGNIQNVLDAVDGVDGSYPIVFSQMFDYDLDTSPNLIRLADLFQVDGKFYPFISVTAIRAGFNHPDYVWADQEMAGVEGLLTTERESIISDNPNGEGWFTLVDYDGYSYDRFAVFDDGDSEAGLTLVFWAAFDLETLKRSTDPQTGITLTFEDAPSDKQFPA